MANFEVPIVKIDSIMDHPNADRLTLIKIGGYSCIANKHEDGSWRYETGDLVAYIPENSILPNWILRRLDMWNGETNKGVLNGKDGNRVKAIKLRGTFSEGIIFATTKELPTGAVIATEASFAEVVEGQDVAGLLGITKYEPVIPSSMSGDVFSYSGDVVKFDLEPIEKYPDLFVSGEPVDVTEKLHGTFFGITILTDKDGRTDTPEAFSGPTCRNVLLFSKGLGQKGLMFKDNDKNTNNIYVQAWNSINTESFWKWYDDLFYGVDQLPEAIHIIGEIYGKGVQDLDYNSDKKKLSIFAIGSTIDHDTFWACQSSISDHCITMGASRVPLLWSGPYSPELVVQHRDGKTTLGGTHIREGVVVYSQGRVDPSFGNVKLKSVSPKYKLRKGGTEFN